MSDAKLRELERRWRETGAEEDRLAWLVASERAGESVPVAILGCLHANLEALTAVWADMLSQGVGRAVCLGDLVGYGPNPLEVVDQVRRRCEWSLLGNHDEALLLGARNFGLNSRRAIEWTRTRLAPRFWSRRTVRERWAYLETLSLQRAIGEDLFVHGSPRDPTIEYIQREDIFNGNLEKFEEIFAAPFERFLFVAHSHMPSLIQRDLTYLTPSDLGGSYEHQGQQQVIVNVGSVGQPRDRDPRACYLIQRGPRLEWRRVAYDVETTARKIEALPELSDALAQRLREGI
tara:strand:+ start:1001 stop:1870 length:870 start_codon:yes stop_codon:yes gene_type:complete